MRLRARLGRDSDRDVDRAEARTFAMGMRRGVVALIFALVAAACTGGGSSGRGERAPQVSRGGTLMVAMQDASLTLFAGGSFDPQRAYWGAPLELYRCCLTRTLLSYTGRPTEEGGATLAPDLAEAMPSVSPDGLTWTFRLRAGLHYAPPFADTPIVVQDVIRAFERVALLPDDVGYGFYYSVIDGFDSFGAREIDSIRGLYAPDDRTLIVQLTEPTSDLGYRLSLPATAPIPPVPTGGTLGAATGHTDYSRFLVSSGPYMFEGSGALDFTVPPNKQDPVAGYVPHKSVTLVRNPSWDPSTDRLRGAFVDRIEIALRRSLTGDWAKVRSGLLDLVFDASPPPDVLADYGADPSLRDQLLSNADNFVAAISMNLAVPPFDDLHVRRAVNWAIDKSSLVRLVGTVPTPPLGYLYGEAAGHLVPDSLENNILQDRDLYPTPGNAGSVVRAREEMARSTYDHDHDGVCDAAACEDVLAITQAGPFPAMAAEIKRNLEPIGIDLRLESMNIVAMFAALHDREAQVPLGLGAGWAADFPAASQSFAGVFSAGLARNDSNIGAEPEQLREWGYAVTEVPNVDDRIAQCQGLSTRSDATCWAKLDTYMMEQVAPWAPYVFFTQHRTVSARVSRFSFAQFQGLPALDQIALESGSS